MTEASSHTSAPLVARTQAERDALRRLSGQVYLRERLDPTMPQHTLPHRMTHPVPLRCAVEAKLRIDGAMLAAVAPFVLTSRPVVVHTS